MTPLSKPEIESIRERHFTRASRHPAVYLATHSLGRPLDSLPQSLLQFADLWFDHMDDAWEPWLEATNEFCSIVAKNLSLPDHTHIVPKTSAGQGLRAVLSTFDPATRPNVVSTSGEFDSIDFILRAWHEQGAIDLTLVEPQPGTVPLFSEEEIAEAVTPQTDLVVVSRCCFTTGQVLDVESIARAAHTKGARVLVDLYHAFGSFPTTLEGCDFAIGGSYKYVRGGPGACWLALSPNVATNPELKTRDTGWFAKAETFGYNKGSVDRQPGGRAWWESTPPVATVYQALPGLRLMDGLTVQRLRATSLQVQQAMRDVFSESGVPLVQPQDPGSFGAFSLLPAHRPQDIVQRLKGNGVIVDARNGFVRFGPDFLTRDDELETAARVLRNVLA